MTDFPFFQDGLRGRRLKVLIALVLLAGVLPIRVDPAAAEPNEGSTPVVSDDQRRISAGGLHTCAVLDTGEVQCWGQNANGQLGVSTTASTSVPKKVIGITTALGVTGGSTHTCALVHDSGGPPGSPSSGTVRCWGNNGSGQLGNGSTSPPDGPVLAPVNVLGLTDVTATAAGGFHTCALRAGGTVHCWGTDGSGQLGDGGGMGTSYTPVTVTVDADPDPAVEALAPLTGATAVASGEYHSCAVIGATGAVKCWGHNGFGQLGNGTTETVTSAVTVSAIPDDDPHAHPPHKAVAISAGQSHTCAVLDDNTARCWGHNFYGQLGNNTTYTLANQQGGTDSHTPVTVKYDADPGAGPLNVDIQPLDDIVSITTGQFHTCAGLSDGSARCWGNNGRGQLGDGITTTNKNIATPVPALTTGVRAVTAGGFHTCALVTGDDMKCWGYNFYGQLGSYELSSLVPVTVTGLSGVTTTATTGDGHACALVISAEAPPTDQPVCWGNNASGELGANLTPSPSNSTIPVEVFGVTDAGAVGPDPVGFFAPISAGNEHACLLAAGSGTPRCWGRNTNGELGSGNNTSSNFPVNVSGLSTVSQLSAGGELFGAELGHTCAVLTDNTARCWGFNGYGELGNSTTVTSNVPVTVKSDHDDDHLNTPPPALTAPINLANATAVAAGGRHSCALISSGTVRCWGRNFDGQLGDGTTTDRPFAVTVDTDPDEPDPDETTHPAGKEFVPLTGITAIAAGARHNCALKNDNTIWCWGRNANGQLGTGNNTPSNVPVKVQNLPLGFTVLSIAAGDNHTCARVKGGDNNTTMLCWGDNAFGQLGIGTTDDSLVPVAPSGLGEPGDDVNNVELVRGISAGRKNTCAVLIETSVSCWGDNEFRQIGDGVGSLSKAPIEVKDLGSVGGNSIPDANDDTATTAPATPVTIAVLGNDTDADGTVPTVNGIPDAPDRGNAVINGGTTITYTPNGDFCTADPTSNTDTFVYTATDGTATVPATVTITVLCPNTAPDAVDDTATTPEETAVTVTVLANDTDINGDTMSVSPGSVSDPANGAAVINPDGNTVKYTPDTNFFGMDTFTYKARDAVADSAPATVTVTVSNVNDPPVANDDNAVTTEDTAVSVNVVANDTDVDSPSIAISSVGPAGHGSASAESPTTITYTPSPNFCGIDSLIYTLSDGSATDTATLTVTVTCANDGPNANDDAGTTSEDTPVVINVLANDTDPEGDPLTVSAVTNPPHGAAVIDLPDKKTITYTPDPNFCGVDSFGYTATDGTASDSALVVPVNVTCNNDPPVANADSPTTNEDAPVGIEVLANDTDPDAGDTLSVVGVTDPDHGSTQIESSGFVTYSPDANFCGADTFNYTISDGNGANAIGMVTATVTCVNDAPVISPIPNKISPWDEEVSHLITASDPDTGDALTYSLVSGPSGASVDSSSGTFSWTPSDSQVGEHTIVVRATDDGTGTLSDDESFTVKVVKRVTFVTYLVGTSGQYSDPVTVSAELTDFEGNPVSGKTLSFTIGTRSTTAVTNVTGTASGSIVLSDPAGLYSVVTGFAGDSAYSASSTSEPFTIEKELVTVTFTGNYLTVLSVTSSPATLKATVAEEADGSLGNGIATLQVQFRRTSGTLLCSSSVSFVSAGQGTATCNTPSLDLGSRAVIVSVTGASYAGPVDVGVFTISQLPSGSAAGAGRIITYPNGLLTTDDFGFMARPGAKKSQPPVGNAIHVFRDGSFAYVVQSSSLTSLSRSCSGGKDKVCAAAIEAAGASKIAIELATGIVDDTLLETSLLKMNATDVAEPSGGSAPPDTYAVDITGGTTYSLGIPTLQLLINYGNIRVPS